MDLGGMPLKGLELLARNHVPQDRRLVPGPGDEVLAVAAEAHAVDPCLVPLQGLKLLARGRLPQDCRPLDRPGDDHLVIAAECYAVNDATSPEGLELVGGGRLPQNRRPVLRPCDDQLTVAAHRQPIDQLFVSLEGLEHLACTHFPQDGSSFE